MDTDELLRGQQGRGRARLLCSILLVHVLLVLGGLTSSCSPPSPPWSARGAALSDQDGDGVSDGDDSCPSAANPDQADYDGDGLGDVCDASPGKADSTNQIINDRETAVTAYPDQEAASDSPLNPFHSARSSRFTLPAGTAPAPMTATLVQTSDPARRQIQIFARGSAADMNPTLVVAYDLRLGAPSAAAPNPVQTALPAGQRARLTIGVDRSTPTASGVLLNASFRGKLFFARLVEANGAVDMPFCNGSTLPDGRCLAARIQYSNVSGTNVFTGYLFELEATSLAAFPPPSPLSFAGPTTRASGRGYGLYDVDLNRDGRPDLVIAGQNTNSFSIALGNGDGTFQAPRSVASGDATATSLNHLAAGDLNGDGVPDLVSANYIDGAGAGGSLSVFIGNGDGSVQPARRIVSGGRPYSVVIADVNGDGKRDLVAHAGNAAQLYTYLGNGDGTFQGVRTHNDTITNRGFLSAGDLNGDGRVDLLLTGYESDQVVSILGNGDGTFQAPRALPGVSGGPFGGSLADVTGDGVLDALVPRYNIDTVTVLRGVGDGTFAVLQDLSVPGRPAWVHGADLDGDGRGDIAVAAWTAGQLVVHLNRGDNTFGPASRYTVNANVAEALLADVDGDGRKDLLGVGWDTATLFTFLNTTAPRSGAPVLMSAQPRIVTAGVTVTVNGANFTAGSAITVDGAAATTTFVSPTQLTFVAPARPVGGGPVALRVNTARGAATRLDLLRYTSPVAFGPVRSYPVTTALAWVTAADLNGDGRMDILAPQGNGVSRLGVLLGNPDGSLASAQYQTTGLGPYSAAVADLNGDGRQDVVLSHYNNAAYQVFPGSGDGSLPAVAVTGRAGSGGMRVRLADVNYDGRLDQIVAAYSSGAFYVGLGNGDGTFQVFNIVGGSAGNSMEFRMADMNNDGVVDIVASYWSGPLGAVHLGNGNGTFQVARAFGAGLGTTSIATGDVNGDGMVDIVSAPNGQRAVMLLRGNGDGNVQAPQVLFAPGDVDAIDNVDLVDIDGDGRLDLTVNVSRGVGGVALRVLRGNGDGTFLPAQDFSVPGNLSYSHSFADLNGDGRLDLVMPGYNTAQIYVRLGLPLHCNDGQRSGDESAVDCGGSCGPCAVGLACAAAADCGQGVCEAGVCRAPRSCLELGGGATGFRDGQYNIQPPGEAAPFAAQCDMAGGGWTLFGSMTSVPFTYSAVVTTKAGVPQGGNALGRKPAGTFGRAVLSGANWRFDLGQAAASAAFTPSADASYTVMTFDTLRAQSNADIRLNKQVLGVQTTATGYLSSSLVALYGLWGSTINGTAYTTPDASGCNGTNVGFFTVPNQGAAGGHNVKNSLDIAQHLNCNNAATGQTITSAQFWYR